MQKWALFRRESILKGIRQIPLSEEDVNILKIIGFPCPVVSKNKESATSECTNARPSNLNTSGSSKKVTSK